MEMMAFLQICSIFCVIITIERDCKDPSEIRFKAYPVIVLFYVAPLIALGEYKKMRNEIYN